MKLVIAEKPSVAMALAAVLGADEKKDGYLEGGGYLVSWCVGHLLELAQPEAYGEQYARWRYGDLPILPDEWKYEVPKDKKKQLDLLCRLMKDKRVDSVVCATDAGREGELIFRLVYEYAGCRKPMERLWISSMEDAAIRDGFEHLRPGKDYDRLYEAAVCRAGADWLVGINATRLFSVLYGVTLNVGRVMSPTLALLVQREAEIQAFTSRPLPPITITATAPYALSQTGRICIISSTVRAGPILRRKCWSVGLHRISMRSLPGYKTAFSGSLKHSGKSCSPGSPSSRLKAICGTRSFTRKDRPAIIICWTAG